MITSNDGENVTVFIDWDALHSAESDVDGLTLSLPLSTLSHIVQNYHEETE